MFRIPKIEAIAVIYNGLLTDVEEKGVYTSSKVGIIYRFVPRVFRYKITTVGEKDKHFPEGQHFSHFQPFIYEAF